MNELQLAIDWEVGPYYNGVLDGELHTMPSIDTMVATVRAELTINRYVEGGKYPLSRPRKVIDREVIYDAIAAEYYPHLVLLPVPTMSLWIEGERVMVYYDFDSAILGCQQADSDYIMLIDGVPMLVHEAEETLRSMRHSGHYKE